MSEGAFWKEIKKNVRYGHWDRIESHATAPGFPDTTFTIGGCSGKMELKFSIDEVPKIRTAQVRWFRREIKNGGDPWLFSKVIINGHSTYVLHEGKTVELICNLKNVNQFTDQAYKVWCNKMSWDQLINILAKDKRKMKHGYNKCSV